MKYLLPLITLSLLFSQELEVEGDLKVTGTVESTTIDSLEQVIASMQAQIDSIHADNQLGTKVYEIEINQGENIINLNELTGLYNTVFLIRFMGLSPVTNSINGVHPYTGGDFHILFEEGGIFYNNQFSTPSYHFYEYLEFEAQESGRITMWVTAQFPD